MLKFLIQYRVFSNLLEMVVDLTRDIILMVLFIQGRKKPWSDCPGQVNFDLGQMKIEVWWPSGQVKLPYLFD